MKTRLFRTYKNGSPIYSYIELASWPFVMPCDGVNDIRDTYHCYVWRNGRCHKGIDFIGNEGYRIYSVGNGTVIDAGYDSVYGNNLTILHGYNSGYRVLSRYAHLHGYRVKKNEIVVKNQIIGLMGSTGDCGNPPCNHLHFEIKIVGIDERTRKLLPFDYAKAVDPIPFLPIVDVMARYRKDWQNKRLPSDLGL